MRAVPDERINTLVVVLFATERRSEPRVRSLPRMDWREEVTDTKSADVPIRQFIVRSATWEAGSTTLRHRFALIVAMILAAIVLFVLMPHVVH